MFLVQKNVRTGQLICEQVLIMLSTCDSQSQTYESKHLPIPDKPFDGICLDCEGPLERSK